MAIESLLATLRLMEYVFSQKTF